MTRRLTITEAVSFTGLGERVIKLAVRRGDLPALKPNGPRGRLYFTQPDLEAWLTSAAQAAAEEPDMIDPDAFRIVEA